MIIKGGGGRSSLMACSAAAGEAAARVQNMFEGATHVHPLQHPASVGVLSPGILTPLSSLALVHPKLENWPLPGGAVS